jgi:hypothetical protein
LKTTILQCFSNISTRIPTIKIPAHEY